MNFTPRRGKEEENIIHDRDLTFKKFQLNVKFLCLTQHVNLKISHLRVFSQPISILI